MCCKITLFFFLKFLSAVQIFCKPTYEGGCVDFDGKYRLDEKKDREYTLDECYGLCSVVKECAGFFHSTTIKYCALVRNGCERNVNADLKYYSMDDCRFGNRFASLISFKI